MEADLEDWARGQIFNAGGLMLKWVIPGRKGPPDNIVFWPGKVVHFLEFKDGANGVVQKIQTEFHRMLALYGHKVEIPRDRVWVNAYIERYSVRRHSA